MYFKVPRGFAWRLQDSSRPGGTLLSANPSYHSLTENAVLWAASQCGFGSNVMYLSENWGQSLLRARPGLLMSFSYY